MKTTGGCYCKEIRYEIDGPPDLGFQCHCRQCQYITGGNPNVAFVYPQENFRYTSGTVAEFRRSDLENPVTRFFCPTCGTGIGTHSPARPGSMIVKVGTLDDPTTFKANVAIFTCDQQPYHHIPDDVPAFDKRPG